MDDCTIKNLLLSITLIKCRIYLFHMQKTMDLILLSKLVCSINKTRAQHLKVSQTD